MDNLTPRVLDGIAVLDRTTPSWFRSVDPDTLDITSARNCVLGQTYGSFYDALNTLTVNETVHPLDWAQDHGFLAGDRRYDGALTRIWAYAVRARQAS